MEAWLHIEGCHLCFERLKSLQTCLRLHHRWLWCELLWRMYKQLIYSTLRAHPPCYRGVSLLPTFQKSLKKSFEKLVCTVLHLTSFFLLKNTEQMPAHFCSLVLGVDHRWLRWYQSMKVNKDAQMNQSHCCLRRSLSFCFQISVGYLVEKN